MTLELSNDQVTILNNVFVALDDSDVNYAVLRRFEGYPEYIPGTDIKILDIDILISQSDFNDAVKISKNIGFSPRKTSKGGLSGLTVEAARNPHKALLFPFENPSRILSLVSSAAKETASLQPKTPYQKACENEYAYQLTRGEIILDLKNHLSHVSPLNQDRIRLDPEVEKQMLERRKNNGYFYVLDTPDELAHIVTHCIFEYNGEFPEYYWNRCERLKEKMNESERQLFKKTLGNIYYSAADVVFECVHSSEYDEIRSKLISYSDY